MAFNRRSHNAAPLPQGPAQFRTLVKPGQEPLDAHNQPSTPPFCTHLMQMSDALHSNSVHVDRMEEGRSRVADPSTPRPRRQEGAETKAIVDRSEGTLYRQEWRTWICMLIKKERTGLGHILSGQRKSRGHLSPALIYTLQPGLLGCQPQSNIFNAPIPVNE